MTLFRRNGMETLNQFNWPEVAAIAGGTIVLLMALITALLAILLKRSGKQENGNGVIVQVKEIQHSIEVKIDSMEGKLDQEIIDRKEDFESVRNCVERGRVERRQDINVIHNKLDKGLGKVVKDFAFYCEKNQTKCVALQQAERNANRQKIETANKLIENLDKGQRRKWEQQEKFNLRFLGKTKMIGI
jgi:hypothetical protein